MSAMQPHNKLYRPIFILCFLLSFSLTSQAEPHVPDEEQPIHITADHLEVQEKTGISTYTGNVNIQQGSLELTGDTVTIIHPDGQLEMVKAYGAPAQFKRFSQVEQSWINGQANLIQYNTKYKTILLSGDAKVMQPGKHTITGSNIFYDVSKQTLMAKGSKDGHNRVSVTFKPAPSDDKE
ncbi:hypothetical protein MNBD_GAMMA04-2192 [hydrothermal vent metagenome]|uniref:Organic solvent tolerance-like N-terminal domain-containing protein n=1 Tax=hydrothermal vent metagenome TaxID=652676 RepID=A0A3B0X044_9ZZZZ